MKLFVLFDGIAGDDRGIPVAIFKTKKALKQYVRMRYPQAVGRNRESKSELYWEYDGDPGDTGAGWLRAEEVKAYV